MLFVCHPKILCKHCLQFLLGVKMAPRETENDAYLGWQTKSIMVFYGIFWSGQLPIHHFGKERGTGTEMRPAIVSGIVT